MEQRLVILLKHETKKKKYYYIILLYNVCPYILIKLILII